MTGLGPRARAAVLAVTALVLLASGCGTQQVVQSQRADVTAAPPPDGSQVVAATPKPHHREHHKKAARTKPGQWPVMHDRKSGLTLALPVHSDAVLDDYPGPGGGTMHTRSYTAETLNDLTLIVAVQDTTKFEERFLDFMERATEQQLVIRGASNVVQVGTPHRLTVGGRPAVEYGMLFNQVGETGRGMMRVTVILLPKHLVIAETFGGYGFEESKRQGQVAAMHTKLMSHLRVA